MSVKRWKILHRLCWQLAAALLKQGVPLTPAPLPPACEAAIDHWVRAYARGGPECVFPSDPLERRGLLGRLRSAEQLARSYDSAGLPAPIGSDADLLEVLLIDEWHRASRDAWLRSGADARRN
jgi:hypothetical protein